MNPEPLPLAGLPCSALMQPWRSSILPQLDAPCFVDTPHEGLFPFRMEKKEEWMSGWRDRGQVGGVR